MTMARGVMIVLFVLLAACSGGGSTAPAAPPCTTPDRAPQVVSQAVPEMPQIAQQQGIVGDVVVRVLLDQFGGVVNAVIFSSPSAVLNQAALTAARTSTYAPGLKNCTPGGTLDVTFHFAGQ
jgi:TonB family protein